MLQTSSTVNGGSWWFKMAGLSEAEKIALLEPELQSLLDARKVGASVQAALHDAGVDGLNMLAAIATSRDELKAFARDSLAIDGSTRAEDVVRFATSFLAWQSSCSRVKIQDELNSELAAQKQPKAIPPMEMQSLRMQFEKAYYRMKDAEIPARASFEDLCEQLDSGELRAMSLRHFGSKADDEDVEAGTLQLGKAGQVKIRRSRIETAAPTDMEGLRSKITLMANHFLFAKFRYTNKAVLEGLTPFSFLDYVGYLTGKHVASLESQTIDGVSLHRPSIKMVVHYDHQMRKEVVEKMNAGAAMVDCLKEVVKDSDLRERRFSTPLAVSSATQSLEKSGKEKGWDRDRWHPYPPPKGKGKGKEKGKGKHKAKYKGDFLHSTTRDGRQLCFACLEQQGRGVQGRLQSYSCLPYLPVAEPHYVQPLPRQEDPSRGYGQRSGFLTRGAAAGVQGSLLVQRQGKAHQCGISS